MGDFLNSKIGRRFNLGDAFDTASQHILGIMHPVRASTTVDELSNEVEGSALVLTEVIDWPWATDDEGFSFDQSNLYGVRTACFRLPLADGGGDKDDWVAVPKTLPSGYTAVGRCGLTEAPLYSGHLDSITAFSGAGWNHRTATGLLWDTSDPLQALRALWSPMNRNQTVCTADISDIYSTMWSFYYNDPMDPDPAWVVAPIVSSHVGFRAGRVEITINANSMEASWPNSGSRTLEVVAVRSDKFWDPLDADGSDQPEVLDSASVSWNFSAPTDPAVTTDYNLGAMTGADTGVPYDFFFRYEYDNAGGTQSPAPVYFTRHNTFLGPRTDVPLWYFASMRNRCAPGGIIIP